MTVEITRYVALLLDAEAKEDMTKEWYSCVKNRAPYGVTCSVEASDDNGMNHAMLIKRVSDNAQMYIVPLTRDLLEDEVEKIVSFFSAEHPDLDFDIEATVVRSGGKTELPTINVDQERYLELCTELSKKQHEDWVSARTKDGWRYGQKLNMLEKTHPLLRAWDQLPDKYKTVDFDQPQRLIDLLTQHGYAIVEKDALEVLRK